MVLQCWLLRGAFCPKRKKMDSKRTHLQRQRGVNKQTWKIKETSSSSLVNLKIPVLHTHTSILSPCNSPLQNMEGDGGVSRLHRLAILSGDSSQIGQRALESQKVTLPLAVCPLWLQPACTRTLQQLKQITMIGVCAFVFVCVAPPYV